MYYVNYLLACYLPLVRVVNTAAVILVSLVPYVGTQTTCVKNNVFYLL